MVESVGVVGLGIMGGAFARNIADAGFEVAGYDLESERMEALAAHGGKPASSVGDTVGRSEVTILSLPSVSAFQQVVDEVAAAAPKNAILIDTSTLPLDVKEAGERKLKAAGVTLLDCPISGTGPHAVTKNLVVLGSGDEAAYQTCLPVIAGFALEQRYLGPFGNGTKMKLVANTLVTIHVAAAAEAMIMGMKAGLDPILIHEVLSASAAGSAMFSLRGALMAKNDYLPAMMKIEVFQKDLDIIGKFAKDLGSPAAVFEASLPPFRAAMADHAHEDTAAICAVLEEQAGIKR